MAALAQSASASGILQGALYGTKKQSLAGSVSLPTLLPTQVSALPADKRVPPPRERLPGVSMQAMLKFLFPSRLENPDSCGRLEIFGKYGPTDEEGNLRGGTNGAHVNTDNEVSNMIEHNCREALYTILQAGVKDRSTVECTVNTLMPTAMGQRYTDLQVKQLLRNVPRHKDFGRMMFTELSETILASQNKRLNDIARRAMTGQPICPPKERPIKVPFQSKTAHTLLAVTRKKKHICSMEEEISQAKRLHAYGSLCASLEDQALGGAVRMNSNLCRDLGLPNDKWDRYCALRRTGRSSYIQTRNTYRFNPSMDCGLGNKHPAISSLLAASCAGSSAGAVLGAM